MQMYSIAKLNIPITPDERKAILGWATNFYRNFPNIGVKPTLHACAALLRPH